MKKEIEIKHAIINNDLDKIDKILYTYKKDPYTKKLNEDIYTLSFELALKLKNNKVLEYLKNIYFFNNFENTQFVIHYISSGYIHIIKFLIENDILNLTYDENFIFEKAILSNNVEIFKYLLELDVIEPEIRCNEAINKAYKNNFWEIIECLWNQKTVRDTLMNDHEDIYNELMKKYIKNKLNNFG
jgi:hypothetical protein